MTDEEFRKLSPFYRDLVLSRCRSQKVSLADFSMDSFQELKGKTIRLAKALGKDPESLKVEEVDRKNDELRIRLKTWENTIPARYRDADLARDFHAPFIERLKNGQSGVVVGGNGIGKTRLAWALARYWKQQNPLCSVQIVKGAELLSEVKAVEGDWYRYIRDRYGDSEHLFIDEIDKIKGSEADWMLLTYLIDYRYEWCWQTVVLGNCDKDETMRLLGQSSYSRLSGDGAEAYHLTGTDRRKEIVTR